MKRVLAVFGMALGIVAAAPMESAATLFVNPSTLNFSGPAGTTLPVQNINLTHEPGSVPFLASVSTTSGGSWLSCTPTSGSTNAIIGCRANTTGLAGGRYTGQATFRVNLPGGESVSVEGVRHKSEKNGLIRQPDPAPSSPRTCH